MLICSPMADLDLLSTIKEFLCFFINFDNTAVIDHNHIGLWIIADQSSLDLFLWKNPVVPLDDDLTNSPLSKQHERFLWSSEIQWSVVVVLEEISHGYPEIENIGYLKLLEPNVHLPIGQQLLRFLRVSVFRDVDTVATVHSLFY